MTHFIINKKNSGNFCTHNICRKNSVLILAVILTKSNWIGFKLNFFKGFKSKFQISFSFRWWHFFYWWQIRFAYSNVNKANENQHILRKNKTQKLTFNFKPRKKKIFLCILHIWNENIRSSSFVDWSEILYLFQFLFVYNVSLVIFVGKKFQ